VTYIRRLLFFLSICGILHVTESHTLYAQVIDETPPAAFSDSTKEAAFQRSFKTVFGQKVSPLFLHPIPALYFITLADETVRITHYYQKGYYSEKMVGEYRSGLPSFYSFDEYVQHNKQNALRLNWAQLNQESRQQEVRRRGLLDFSIAVPGGDQSTFTSIFGKPEVNLRVNGVAQMNIGASIQQSEDPSLPPDQQTRIDPTFDQNLQLNIQGTIGDKLTIQTDWDTERAFEYQNRLNIVYQGYENEIIKSIELGNVTMNTGNSLIRGSGALFGVKSVAELGSLRLTSVISQQDGESSVETISGGSQESTIQIRPADYSNDRFFFMDFYTMQEFENSMSNPQQFIQTLPIADVEVWVLKENIQAEEGSRLAVALAEIGVNEFNDGSYGPPNNQLDPFPESLLNQYRDPQTGVSASDLGINDSRNFEEGYFTLIQEGIDYTINKLSGFVSLRRPLGAREVLAISYNYRTQNNETINVGEINRGGGDRIFLKMLKPKNVSTDNLLFPITMKNIYSLGVSNISRESLELELLFTEDNVASNRLLNRNNTLLQDLGLDRVDAQGALGSDNQIDFGTGTLDAQNGLIIFPYLEPFGERIRDLLEDSPATPEDIERLVYSELYNERQRNASQSSKNSFYQFNGTSRGGSQDNFTLGIALVEGSVRVYANGVELQEDIDYQVDYTFGSIAILNDRYTATGQDIRIEYEDQAFTSIEQKTFTGLRAEYDLSNDIKIGGTYFRFSERPLDDKIRIGEEPISNSVVGFDANAQMDTPFITRFLDWIPLMQTRESSEFTFSGEFAQLMPGISETRAVSRAVRNDELFQDEEQGLSFIDDFEGSNIKINLLNANRWHLAAAPAAIPGYDADSGFFEEDNFPGQPVASQESRLDRADLRSKFSWYSIPRNISTILEDVNFTAESEQVRVTDVFPGRETQNPQEEIITTLDVFYNPTMRGQYNFNSDLKRLLEQETDRTWGGMTAVLPSGQEDFTQNSIEYLEFWVQPILPGGQLPPGASIDDYDGQIFIDIGLISEDVVSNSKLNSEDGLALNPESLVLDNVNNPRSAIPANPPPPEGQFSNTNRELEDVGLDGLPNSGGVNNFNEQTTFAPFVQKMRDLYGTNSSEYRRILEDPSNDDYVFYGESAVQNRPLHERFHRLLGFQDGNTPLDQSDKRAITNRPDTEGLVNPSSVALTNAYFQYQVDLNPADPSRLEIETPGTFIVDRVPGSRQQDRWYQVRIPLNEFKRKIGDINDFQNITYVRIWMSGYEQPFTLRFAALDFVGSQWRQDENINQTSDPNADLQISTINIEENSNRQPIPYRQPAGGIRAQNRGSQLRSLQNEQSIVLDVSNLGPGSVQLIKRVYPGGLDLLNYSNMRMFIHGEGYNNRGDVELVMRFGNDLENNYYEYRQPVTPSDTNFPYQSFDSGNTGQLIEEAEKVWLYDENNMNIILSAFNQLKQLRDQQVSGNFSDVYERSDILENAAPGAVVAIKGNPSLGRVTEVGMGIRNPFDPDDPSGDGTPILNAQLWLNELRVSGFDNEQGWAANARTTLKLADFATVNANVIRQTQGFGALDSRLGQRRVNNELAFDLSSLVNLHSFIPDRFGWSLPVNLSARRSTAVPKFLPNQGDIRFTDLENAIRNRPDLNLEEQDVLIADQRREVETYVESYAINVSNFTKNNSRTFISRALFDNTTINYNYNTTNGRNPQYRLEDNWNYNASARYNLNVRSVKFIRPFWLLDDVPLMGILSGLSIGTAPNNITTSVSTRRAYEERKRRILSGEEEKPLQQTHIFTYDTNLGISYNLTRSISASIQTQSVFDLARDAVVPGNLGGRDSTAFAPLPSVDVYRDLFKGEISPRKSSYNENYTASWQPRLDQHRIVDWITYNTRYSGGFRWENSPFGSDLGARLSNSFRLDHTLQMDIFSLRNRLPIFKQIVEADEQFRMQRSQQSESDNNESGEEVSGNFAQFLRRSFLAIFSLRNIEVNYNNSKAAAQSGYDGDSKFFDLFNNQSFTPSFGYRLGFEERIPETLLIDNPDELSSIQLPINNNYADNISLNTQFNPFTNLTIDLSWQTQWDERISESITLSPQNDITSITNATGNITSSVWAFGAGYENLFKNQLQSAFNGMDSSDNIIQDPNGGNNLILNPVQLQEDFRRAYLGSTNSAGGRNFTAIPMPNWQVNFSGLERFIPFLGSRMQRATLTHAYSGLYRIGWNLNNNFGEPLERRIGSYLVEDFRPEFEPNNVNIEKRFSPLAQINITWMNGLRTQLGYETSQLTSLSVSNTQVIERLSKGIRASINYTLRNFRIPFVRATANNIDLTLNGSFLEDTEQRLLLFADLERALQEPFDVIIKNPDVYDFSPSPPTGQSRINASAVVGYRFSDTIQANLEYAFTQTLPKSSRTFKRTTHDIRFSIRINIRSV